MARRPSEGVVKIPSEDMRRRPNNSMAGRPSGEVQQGHYEEAMKDVGRRLGVGMASRTMEGPPRKHSNGLA